MDTRKFALEGSLHLFSSEASMISPAELYMVKHRSDIREALALCNLYVITRRPRIFVSPNPTSMHIEANTLSGSFLMQRSQAWESISFRYPLPEGIVDVAVDEIGSSILLIDSDGHRIFTPSHVLVATAESPLGDAKDLEVLYVGIGQGRKNPRIAIDRLANHATLQRILSETLAFTPASEILLLMFRFEHHRKYMSTGGDLNLVPTSGASEELQHWQNMSNATFDRRQRVELAEAALIRHFDPIYNDTFTRTDFARNKRIKLLRGLERQGLTGLIAELSTANLGSRLWSPSCPAPRAEDMFPAGIDLARASEKSEEAKQLIKSITHTHFAQVPLTTSEERNTFLHGMRWRESASPE